MQVDFHYSIYDIQSDAVGDEFPFFSFVFFFCWLVCSSLAFCLMSCGATKKNKETTTSNLFFNKLFRRVDHFSRIFFNDFINLNGLYEHYWGINYFGFCDNLRSTDLLFGLRERRSTHSRHSSYQKNSTHPGHMTYFR